MKKYIPPVISAVVFTSSYLILLDYVRPALQQRSLLLAWWVILGAFLTCLFAFQFKGYIANRPKFFALGFLLLCGTVFSYDPSVNPKLAVVGLRWLWAPLLLGSFGWLYQYARTEKQTQAPSP